MHIRKLVRYEAAIAKPSKARRSLGPRHRNPDANTSHTVLTMWSTVRLFIVCRSDKCARHPAMTQRVIFQAAPEVRRVCLPSPRSQSHSCKLELPPPTPPHTTHTQRQNPSPGVSRAGRRRSALAFLRMPIPASCSSSGARGSKSCRSAPPPAAGTASHRPRPAHCRPPLRSFRAEEETCGPPRPSAIRCA